MPSPKRSSPSQHMVLVKKPQALYMPQELCDIIGSHLRVARDVLNLRKVCKTFANAFEHRLIEFWSAHHGDKFWFTLDNIGIAGIEALAKSILADRVVHVVLVDRSLLDHHLEATSEDDVLDPREVPEWIVASPPGFLRQFYSRRKIYADVQVLMKYHSELRSKSTHQKM